MMNLFQLFRRKAYIIPVKKTEKELLECFMANKAAFDQWLALHPHPQIRFRFYFPTAIDFYFDEFKLFTVYFKRGANNQPEFQEFKMSEANHTSLCSSDWRPFEEVIFHFLATLEESNKASLFRKKKSLYEYAAICEKMNNLEKNQPSYPPSVNKNIAAA